MAMHAIEPGQRLQTVVGEQIRFVQVLAEAVVPAGYWLCREEASGQSRVIAQTALSPVAVEPVAVEPVAVEPVAVEPVAVELAAAESAAAESATVAPVAVQSIAVEQIESLPAAPAVMADTAITAAA